MGRERERDGERDEAHAVNFLGTTHDRTVCPSGLRGWTQVPLAQAAWAQIPQLSMTCLLLAYPWGLVVFWRGVPFETGLAVCFYKIWAAHVE